MSNLFLFAVFPWLAFGVGVVGLIYRFRQHLFTQTSRSSQFLEKDALFWGSMLFHWGVVFLFFFHLFALLLPWRGLKLWIVEVTGFALGLSFVLGLFFLLFRRLLHSRIQAVSNPMDYAVLLLLIFQGLTGLSIALFYRWGFGWMAHVAGPWLGSLLTFRPDLSTITPLPLLIKAHFLNAFLLFALFPFSRLSHLLSIPLSYLFRPYQVVAWHSFKEVNHE